MLQSIMDGRVAKPEAIAELSLRYLVPLGLIPKPFNIAGVSIFKRV
jgi:hypothetical protein